MHIRSVLKNIVLAVSLIVILVTGIVLFVKLTRNKKALETDLYNYIPSHILGILQVNNYQSIIRLSPLMKRMQPLTKSIGDILIYPVLFIEYDSSSYMMMKVTEDQKELIRQKLELSLFPDYPPGEKTYKGNKLLFYATGDNSFFICMFYDDFFVGGYNIGLFEEIIDRKASDNKVITDSPLGKEMLGKMKKHYPANLFLNNSTCFSVFNIDFADGRTELEGYNTSIPDTGRDCDTDIEDINIDYTIFPDTFNYYRVEMYNPVVTDTFECYFEPPSYTFNIGNHSENVHAIRHKDDKFVIYNMLNDLQEKYTGKKFNINDIHAGYRIYTTSAKLGYEVFGSEKEVYLTFYKGFLITGEDKETLKTYLKYNGKYRPDRDIDISAADFESLYYSTNIGIWSPDFFSPENPITRHLNKEAYTMSFKEGERHKIRISINN